MRLFLVRHAEAAPGEPDELRPLTDAGKATARTLGEQLAAHAPRTVICSPLLRARETADAIARAAGIDAEVDERLAPGATPGDVVDAAAGRGETVVLVGHQPDCGAAAAALSGGPEPAFPPCGHVVLELGPA
jgi:phosphohistidine phosphatase